MLFNSYAFLFAFLPIALVGYFLLGALLSGAGLYAFSAALDTSSFSKVLIAVLLLLYGGFILKNLIAKN